MHCKFVEHSKKFKYSIYNEFKNCKFTHILSPSQPAIRPGSTSATALEFLHNKGNHVEFMKLLFQSTFIHCAIVLSLILYYLAFIFKSLTEGESLRKGEKLAKAVDKLVGKV